MGSWGVGLRKNDMAADAVDTYGDRLNGIEIAKVRSLIQSAKRRCGIEGALGLAEEALDRGFDLRPLRKFFIPLLKSEEQELRSWKDNAAARRRVLLRFRQRLDSPPTEVQSRVRAPRTTLSVPKKYRVGQMLSRTERRGLDLNRFSPEGLQPWEMGSGYGYVNRTGRIVIPPLYEEAVPFADGRGVVYTKNGIGLIDKSGAWVLKPEWDHVESLREGRAVVRDRRGRYGFVDRTGRFIIPLSHQVANSFSEGLAAVCRKKRWGYINRQGRTMIPFQFREAGNFHHGLALVRDNLNRPAKINPSGKILSRTAYSERKTASEGLMPVGFNGRWGYCDLKGREVIPLQFSDADTYSDGVARVAVGSGKSMRFGLIDKKGRLILKTIYPALSQFSDGLARIAKKKKEGFVDRKGRLVVPLLYDEALWFEKGLARVRLKKYWGYIDAENKTVIPFQFEACREFAGGLAAVKQKGRWGFIDRHGRWAIPAQFAAAESFSKGSALVNTGSVSKEKWRRIDRAGRQCKDV